MNFQRSANSANVNREGGFSLIELAIALVVIGLLLVPALQTYKLWVRNKTDTVTSGAVVAAHSALLKYVARYGRYPIPSPRNVPLGTAGFGQPAPLAAWPACAATSMVVCRTATNAYLGRGVLIGDLPFAALGIPYKAAIDGYGNKLTYAVTEALTANATFNDSVGGIEVLDSAGASIYGGVVPRAHFAVVSHGDDRRGAHTLNAVLGTACGAAANGTDFENCNGDARFRNNNFSATVAVTAKFSAAGANHFDDVIMVTNTSSSGIWSMQPSTPNIRTDLGGNILIGTCSTFNCIPRSRVDVMGSVRADTIESTRMCNYASGGCVSNYTGNKPQWGSAYLLGGTPPALAPTDPSYVVYDSGTKSRHNGAGIRCIENQGLNGINSYDESCNVTSYFDPTVNIGSCSSGYYPKGLSNTGQLICVLP